MSDEKQTRCDLDIVIEYLERIDKNTQHDPNEKYAKQDQAIRAEHGWKRSGEDLSHLVRQAMRENWVMREALLETCRNAGGACTDAVSTEFLVTGVPTEVRLVIQQLRNQVTNLNQMLNDEKERHQKLYSNSLRGVTGYGD